MYFLIAISLYLLWVIVYFLWERSKKKKLPEDSCCSHTPLASDEIIGKSTFVLGDNKFEEAKPAEKINDSLPTKTPISLDELNKAFHSFSSEKQEVQSESYEEDKADENVNEESEADDEDFDENDEYYQSQSCITPVASVPPSSLHSTNDIYLAFQALGDRGNSVAEKQKAMVVLADYEQTEVFQKIIASQTELVNKVMSKLPSQDSDVTSLQEQSHIDMNMNDFV